MAPNSADITIAPVNGQDELLPRTPQGFVAHVHGVSDYGEVYDSLCDNFKEFCGQLRAFADGELQQAVRAVTNNENDKKNMAWYNFAVHQKDELNKDINFYEIELDDLINRDEVEIFLEQFKEIRSSLQNMYNKSTMAFHICGNSTRPAPSSRIPVRASSRTLQKLTRQSLLNNQQTLVDSNQIKTNTQVRSSSIPPSSIVPKPTQNILRRQPSSEAALSRKTMQPSRISRPTSKINQPRQQSQTMLANTRQPTTTQGTPHPNKFVSRSRETTRQALPRQHSTGRAILQADPFGKGQPVERTSKQSLRNQPSVDDIKPNKPTGTRAIHAAKPTAAVSKTTLAKQYSQTQQRQQQEARPRDPPPRKTVPLAQPIQTARPSSIPTQQMNAPTRTNVPSQQKNALPIRQAGPPERKPVPREPIRVPKSADPPTRPTITPARLASVPIERQKVPAEQIQKQIPSGQQIRPAVPPARPARPTAPRYQVQAPKTDLDRETASVIREQKRVERTSILLRQQMDRDDARAQKEYIKSLKEDEARRLSNLKYEKESAARQAQIEEFFAEQDRLDLEAGEVPKKIKVSKPKNISRKPISNIRPHDKDDVWPEPVEEQFEIIDQAKELQKQVDDLVKILQINLDEQLNGPDSIPEAIDSIRQAVKSDNPVKLLTVLTQCCEMATKDVSKKLVAAIKRGYETAFSKYEHLRNTNPLQHWIDMYMAVATEVQEINQMLKEKYRTTSIENYNICDKTIAKFDAFNERVLDRLRQEMSRKNPREMAKIVFNAITPLTEGRYCCNDKRNPDSPALEVRILALPDILRQNPEMQMAKPAVELMPNNTQFEQGVSLGDMGIGYSRVVPTKGSPIASMFLSPAKNKPSMRKVKDFSQRKTVSKSSRERPSDAIESTKEARINNSASNRSPNRTPRSKVSSRTATPAHAANAEDQDQTLEIITDQYVEALTDPDFSGTGGSSNTASKTPPAQTTATPTVSSSNMLNAAKRYASMSPDRHQSSSTKSPNTPKGHRSALPGKELEDSIKKTEKEYEHLRDIPNISNFLHSDDITASTNHQSRSLKKKGMVMSALNHLHNIDNLDNSVTSSKTDSPPLSGEPGYSRFQLNNLNKDIAQMVNNEPKTNVEVPVPLPILNEPDLFYAIEWENNDDDDESLELSYRAEAMLESRAMKELYVSGQKKLLQYDNETVEDMKRKVSDGQKRIFDRVSDSEEDLAVAIAVAEKLEESIRQNEIPMATNRLNDYDAVPISSRLIQANANDNQDCSSNPNIDSPLTGEDFTSHPNETNKIQKETLNYYPSGITTVLYTKISQRHCNLLQGSMCPPTVYDAHASKESKSACSLFTRAWSTVREDMHFI